MTCGSDPVPDGPESIIAVDVDQLELSLDEQHPMMPFKPYGLSRRDEEDIGRVIALNSDTIVVSLRLTNVALPEMVAEFP